MALSQAGIAKEGLYGPVPLAGITDYVSIIYSRYINTPEQQDFILFCLLYPSKKGALFHDRLKLEAVFQSLVFNLESLHDLTAEFHEELKEILYRSIITSRLT